MRLTAINLLFSINLLAILTNSALADTTQGEQDRSSEPVLEEIFVTGRRMPSAERIQDVPLSVTAISGDRIEASGMSKLTDVGFTAPNVRLSPQATVPMLANFYIRGMGLNGSVISDDPTVGVYVDGMYLGISAGVLTDMVDVEAVEILRGPQGALFGHSLTGGAAIIHTRAPTGDAYLKVRTELSSNDSYAWSVIGENQLTDTTAGKLLVYNAKRGDSYNNIAPSTLVPRSDDIGESNILVVKPSFRYGSDNNFNLTVRTEFGKAENDVGARRALLGGGSDVVEQLYNANPQIERPHGNDLSVDYTPILDSRWRQVIAEANWDFDQHSLKSITGYRDYYQEIGNDVDGTPFRVFNFIEDTRIKQRQFSQEFLVHTSLGNSLDLISGLYYFEQEFEYREHRDRLASITALELSEEWSLGRIKQQNIALFANTEFALNEQWNLVLGGRLDATMKQVKMARRAGGGIAPDCPNGFDSCTFNFSDSMSNEAFIPKVGLQWWFEDNSQTYFSYSSGQRTGGYNIRGVYPENPGPYDEEKLHAYEWGLKSTFWAGRARTHVVAFYNDYNDLQRTVINDEGNQAILNAASAVIRGLEFDSQISFGENFSLDLSIGWMEGYYKRFSGLDVTGDQIPDPELARQLDIPDVPRWTRSIGFDYRVPLGDGDLRMMADYAYTSEQQTNEVNTVGIPQYELFNASVRYSSVLNPWSVTVFVRNLKDVGYLHSAFATSCCDPSDLAPVRNAGIRLDYTFE